MRSIPAGPAFPTDALYRFANGVVDPLPASEGGLGFVCVREDHTKPNPSDVVNAVVCINGKEEEMRTRSFLCVGIHCVSRPSLRQHCCTVL
jgi:hypothetical protein